jgi:hypothetical protein
LKGGGAQISGLRAIDRTDFDFKSYVLTRADDGLTVQLIGDITSATITMYAPDGRLIQTINTEEDYIEIPGTSTWQTGVYVVVVETDAKTWVHKWFKS